MSAGRDKKSRTNERKQQRDRAIVRRGEVRESMLDRRKKHMAKRAVLKAKNA